jgi:hypothetical protein
MSGKALNISLAPGHWQWPDPASAKYCSVTDNRKRVKYLSSWANGRIFQLVRMSRLTVLTVVLSWIADLEMLAMMKVYPKD